MVRLHVRPGSALLAPYCASEGCSRGASLSSAQGTSHPGPGRTCGPTLYEFRARDIGWGIPEPDSGVRSFKYLYDFGDGWEHTVRIERITDAVTGVAYPRLNEGLGRCPPEDVGSPWGYSAFLEAIADPDHEEHEEWLTWGRQPLRSCGRGHRGRRPRSGRSRQAVISLANHPPQAPSLTRGLRRMDTESGTARSYRRTWRVWLGTLAWTGWRRHPILELDQRLTRHPPANPWYAVNKSGWASGDWASGDRACRVAVARFRRWGACYTFSKSIRSVTGRFCRNRRRQSRPSSTAPRRTHSRPPRMRARR